MYLAGIGVFLPATFEPRRLLNEAASSVYEQTQIFLGLSG